MFGWAVFTLLLTIAFLIVIGGLVIALLEAITR